MSKFLCLMKMCFKILIPRLNNCFLYMNIALKVCFVTEINVKYRCKAFLVFNVL